MISVGLLLAAGASRRLGETKALLRFGGETALARLARVLRAAEVRSIVAVVAAPETIAEAERCGLGIVFNRTPEKGRSGSLVLGIAAIEPGSDVLVAPVDCPLVAASTVAAILRETRGEIVRPRCPRGAGHPVLFRASLREELLALAPDEPLRNVVRRDPSRTVDVLVDDLEVVTNLDSPEDVAAARARFRPD